MESIRIWLNGERLYTSGVKLYRLYGKDNLLKRLFASPDVSDYKTKRLTEALIEMLEASKPEPAIKPSLINTVDANSAIKAMAAVQAAIPVAVPPKGETGWSKVMDATEAAMYAKWKPVFTELMDLSSRIYEVALAGLKDPYKKIEAGEMALKVLDLEDECNDFYMQRDHYLAHGAVIDQRPYGEPCTDPMLIPKKLANAERYVRDYKRKLESKPDDTTAAEQLAKHEWFVTHYKSVLKIP